MPRNSELEMLCHAVSHDLRAPLRAVDGFTRMLLQRCEGRLNAEELRLLNVVRTNSATMNRLIDDIVNFARLNRDALRVADIDMARWSSRRGARPPANIPVACACRACRPHAATVTLLKQAWAHLLSNAVKFSAPSAAPVIIVSGERQGDELVYIVRDNGAGFDMNYADKLFKAFQRLHGASEFPGNGIGLASGGAHRRAPRRPRRRRKPPRSRRDVLVLAADRGARRLGPMPSMKRRRRVLIVEDVPLDAEMMLFELEQGGMQTESRRVCGQGGAHRCTAELSSPT